MLLTSVLLPIVLAGAAQAAPAAPSDPDACQLLTFDDVRRVQQVAVSSTKTSGRRANGEQHSNCVFATDDFAHSVSVTLTTADETTVLNDYWKRTFDRGEAPEAATRTSSAARPRGAERPLHRVAGLGKDAVWTSDSKAGSLYVLTTGAVLRISVGGVADVSERLRRSQALAELALRRLEASR